MIPTQQFLAQIYQIDPSLQQYEQYLTAILEQIIQKQGALTVDIQLVERLRAYIQTHLSQQPQQAPQPTPPQQAAPAPTQNIYQQPQEEQPTEIPQPQEETVTTTEVTVIKKKKKKGKGWLFVLLLLLAGGWYYFLAPQYGLPSAETLINQFQRELWLTQDPIEILIEQNQTTDETTTSTTSTTSTTTASIPINDNETTNDELSEEETTTLSLFSFLNNGNEAATNSDTNDIGDIRPTSIQDDTTTNTTTISTTLLANLTNELNVEIIRPLFRSSAATTLCSFSYQGEYIEDLTQKLEIAQLAPQPQLATYNAEFDFDILVQHAESYISCEWTTTNTQPINIALDTPKLVWLYKETDNRTVIIPWYKFTTSIPTAPEWVSYDGISIPEYVTIPLIVDYFGKIETGVDADKLLEEIEATVVWLEEESTLDSE